MIVDRCQDEDFRLPPWRAANVFDQSIPHRSPLPVHQVERIGWVTTNTNSGQILVDKYTHRATSASSLRQLVRENLPVGSGATGG
jgi:hypothetical protein